MRQTTHDRLLLAAEAIHGPLRDHEEREAAKRQRALGAEPRCRLHFERSVMSDLKRAAEHPTFERYARHWQADVDDDYAEFRKRYPLNPSPRMKAGCTYWWANG